MKIETAKERYVGKKFGKYNTKCIDIVGKDKNNKFIGEFICSFDGQKFQARVSDVKANNTQSCGCLLHNGDKYIKYYPGDILGPLDIYMIARLDDGKGKFICPFDGSIFESNIGSVVSGHTKSCGCLKESVGITKIKNILTNNNILYIQEYVFSDCVNPQTNAKLYFDFYLPDYNCCIEYDGEQHFQKANNWNTKTDSLQQRQYRDNIKNIYCEQNCINLIRIPFWELNKIDDKYVIKLLNRDNKISSIEN